MSDQRLAMKFPVGRWSPEGRLQDVTFRTRSRTVRHEKGSSAHVSESLTRGGDRTARKQSKRGNSVRVTGPAKPWITSTLGGQAKLRAVAHANPEQASIDESRVPTLPFCGEGHVGQRDPRRTLVRPAGVWGTARSEGRWINVGDPPRARGRDPHTGRRPAASAEVGEAHGTDEAGNDGGGTGPHFWVLGKRARMWGLT
jgi:hypothetical protein